MPSAVVITLATVHISSAVKTVASRSPNKADKTDAPARRIEPRRYVWKYIRLPFLSVGRRKSVELGGGGVGDGITESNKSRATAIILKALGSDKSSVKFESLICLPPF